MPTPQGVRTVTLRGRYVEPDLLGTPHQGIVMFSPNVPMVMFLVENTLMAGTETATLDANGEFIIDLPCTDTPGQNPVDWTYTVTEKIVGLKPRTFQIVLNFTLEVVELSDVSPTAIAPDYLPVYGPQGPPGVVQSINGYSSTIVNLTAQDVDAVPDSGDSTITGVKTFTSSPVIPVPSLTDEAATKGYVDVLDGVAVKRFGDQDVAGIKTFLSSPIVPTPTLAGEVSPKSYVDDLGIEVDDRLDTLDVSVGDLTTDLSNLTGSVNTLTTDLGNLDTSVVKLTGAQTVAGLKTFTLVPVLPSANPTASDEATRKGYVDTLDSGNVKLTGAQSIAGLKTFSSGIATPSLTLTGPGQIQCPVKGGDTSRASTIAPADDPDLTVPVVANAKYVIEVVGVWTNGGGGFRCDFSGPSGSTMVWTDNDGAGMQSIGSDTTFSVTTGTTFQGALVTSGTAGTLAFRWAQSTSNASSTALKQGCYMKVTRVA